MQDFVKFDNGYSTRAFRGDLAEIQLWNGS